MLNTHLIQCVIYFRRINHGFLKCHANFSSEIDWVWQGVSSDGPFFAFLAAVTSSPAVPGPCRTEFSDVDFDFIVVGTNKI